MISTKGRYALRVMIDMAQQETDEYIPLEEIAQRQGISKKYLESILSSLVKAHLIKGVRGKGGGYKLTRSTNEYPVGEILELAEGTLALVACTEDTCEAVCGRKEECKTLPMWITFDKIVHDFFYSITLEDLMKDGGFEAVKRSQASMNPVISEESDG